MCGLLAKTFYFQIQSWNYTDGPVNIPEQEELMTEKTNGETIPNGKSTEEA